MRTIKFRAWDKNNKCMLDLDDSGIDTYCLHITKNSIWLSFDNSEDPEKYIPPEDFVLMQFTGLKDKNGKGIYEGDIVVKNSYIWFDKGKPNYRGTVEWVYSQWQVIAHCVNKNKRGISDGINEGLNEDGIEENKKSEWEIIGNIYENPDLFNPPKGVERCLL